MKTVVLLLIIVLSLGFAVRARTERSANEAALSAVSVEREALRRDLVRERQRANTARDARAAIAAPAATEAGNPIGVKSRQPSPEAAIANNPALLERHLQARRERLDWGQGSMFRAVGFSPQQIERWKQMIVTDEQRRLDLIAAVETQGLDQRSDTYKALEAESKKFQREQEAEILGELEPKYREYQRSKGPRSLAQWLGRTSIYSEEPITGEQIERATQILAAHTQHVLATDEATPVINWTAATTQLKTVLSPTQTATLQSLGLQFEKIGTLSQQVDQRTKLLTSQFKQQAGAR